MASILDPARDPTLDPSLRSWVESANDPASEFPIQNLPLCRFLGDDDEEGATPRLGMAIGDRIVDLRALAEAGILDGGEAGERCAGWGSIVGSGDWLSADDPAKVIRLLRERVQVVLRAGTEAGEAARRVGGRAVRPMSEVRLVLPVAVPDYTDFYAGVYHAANVGAMFRPDNPLLPNYKHVPIGYHGRASSVVVSGTEVVRPWGQQAPEGGGPPVFAPTRMLDYELEVGAIIGRGNPLGSVVPVGEALGRVLGLCLVNDWSARDIQRWEYQPLGPFLAKNFATTVSPFIVTLDALGPFRCAAMVRGAGDPRPLSYLWDECDQSWGGFDITVEAYLRTAEMRRRGLSAVRLSRGSFRHMYWTIAQMIAHHTCGGCNLRAGDLLASGTISGPEPGSGGCLLELTWSGRGADGRALPRKPVELPTGEKRVFLEDGDEVTLRARCEREGFRSIGFGSCTGVVSAARGVREERPSGVGS
jgi:fumarylacetoacetase